jgi:phosphoserine aminotransferase
VLRVAPWDLISKAERGKARPVSSPKVINFNAGPSGLPRPALERAQREFLDFAGTGISVMEHSHRGKAYEKLHNEAIALVNELLSVPASHTVLLVQGGASAQFALVPMNFLAKGKVADYVITGSWSKKALEEAKVLGEARVAGNGAVGGNFVKIPSAAELDLKPDAAYVHITSNNTIAGTQYAEFPKTKAPLIADMSSDILSRRFDVGQFGLLYAGAQKNLGPSGLTLVVADRALVEAGAKDIPKIFQYRTHMEENSLYNTPPTLAIYLMRNVLDWMKQEGGLAAIEARNDKKAEILYGALDSSGGFYRSPIEKAARSKMNVVFRCPDEALEDKFLELSVKANMIGLKGHRSVGGLRASIYNAVSVEDVQALASLMADFQAKHG